MPGSSWSIRSQTGAVRRSGDGLDHVVGRRLDEASVPQLGAQHALAAVRLDRDHLGDTVRVIDLTADLLALHDLADRHHSLGGETSA